MSDIGVEIAAHDLRMRLAQNIKRLRAAHGLAQERLALDAGVDRTMLSKIERQVTNPSLETLLKISLRLQVDVVALLEPLEAASPVSPPGGNEPPR
jgi:transcriptional regulator with XRE-family HTH domain